MYAIIHMRGDWIEAVYLADDVKSAIADAKLRAEQLGTFSEKDIAEIDNHMCATSEINDPEGNPVDFIMVKRIFQMSRMKPAIR